MWIWLILAVLLAFDFVVSLIDMIIDNKCRYECGLRRVLNIADILIMAFEVIFIVVILVIYL